MLAPEQKAAPMLQVQTLDLGKLRADVFLRVPVLELTERQLQRAAEILELDVLLNAIAHPRVGRRTVSRGHRAVMRS